MSNPKDWRMYDAFVCPVCLGSFAIPDEHDPDCWCSCLVCDLLAPLWYLRLMGIHECERNDYVPAWERLTAAPITLADGREFGRSRRLDDYADSIAEIKAMTAAGYEWVPNECPDSPIVGYCPA